MAMFSLDGQTALVTGGTRGIGQAAAIALAEAGADIILIQVYFLICSENKSFLSLKC
jgi:short-subunit dehydrogenase involved in D-alanine esterification of teichoic acids